MVAFFTLEFTHPAPEVIEVEYKHVTCSVCGSILLIESAGLASVLRETPSLLISLVRPKVSLLGNQSLIIWFRPRSQDGVLDVSG